MQYQFKCPCGNTFTQTHPHQSLPKLKEEGTLCSCGKVAVYSFDPSGVQVCFKGFEWADKNYKEKTYRKSRTSYMNRRQKENRITPKLSPNYKGERTQSWKEAQQEARSEGKISETYDHLVKAEKNA